MSNECVLPKECVELVERSVVSLILQKNVLSLSETSMCAERKRLCADLVEGRVMVWLKERSVRKRLYEFAQKSV